MISQEKERGLRQLSLKLRRELMLTRFHIRKFLEKIRQKMVSKRKFPIGDQTVHIICVRKKEYLVAGARCANSIWHYNPGVRVRFYIDEKLSNEKRYLMRKLNRQDRAEIIVERGFDSWQELKLKVILHRLTTKDFFCDADIYWNAPLPIERTGFYFAAEPSLLSREPYISVLNDSGIQVKDNFFMANSSFIKLDESLDRTIFAREVWLYFEEIRKVCASSHYENAKVQKIMRLSEQIALSIAINSKVEFFKSLKSSDKPMDGGIAESYYLGTTKGWD